jgi:hypothetical protein
MWRWAKRWIDWLRNDLVPLVRLRRGGFAVHVRYDAAGGPHAELPVPWSADLVVVEVLLRLPHAARRKADFAIRFSGLAPISAESVRPDTHDRYRVTFRFPVPHLSVVGEVQWKQQPVAPVAVPVLTAETFLGGLSLANPTLAVRLGTQVVAARAFVGAGCRGLVASAVLHSSHPLGPIADLGLVVEFRSETTGRAFAVPVSLAAHQPAAHEALVTAICPKRPRRPGWWSVTWRAGTRVLAATRIEVIPTRRFEDAVRALDTRFAVAGKDGVVRVLRTPPAAGAFDRVGPCFLLKGDESGAAGLCKVAVFAVAPGNPNATLLLEREILVTDAPTVFTPGLLVVEDLSRVGGFELRLSDRVLGAASLSPVPPATLTSEGGFKPPPEFTWTAAAEEELQERLGRLGNSG